MIEGAEPHRRTFIGSLGWIMGAVGVGGAGFVLLRATGPTGSDARPRIQLPERADDYFKTVVSQGRPIGIRGLSARETAELSLAPGAPPYLVIDLVCTVHGCVVARTADPDKPWQCPCCGSVYALAGRPLYGPAKRNLAIPTYRFIDRRTVLIGPFGTG